MKKKMPDFKIRPHYYFFCGSILVYVFAFLFAKEWLAALFCALSIGIIHYTTLRAPENRPGKLECTGYIFVMSFFFFSTKLTIPMVRHVKYDALLQYLDNRFLFDVEAWVVAVTHPVLTDILTFCYLLYGPLMYSCLLYFGFFKKDLGLAYYSGIFVIFGLGFLGYLLVPAEGPHFARGAEVMPLLASGPYHTFSDPLIKAGCTRSDAFPSLHVGISVFTLFFLFVHARRLFWLWLLPVAGLSVATVYLFYHYQVDIVASLLLLLPASLYFSWKTLRNLNSGKSETDHDTVLQ